MIPFGFSNRPTLMYRLGNHSEAVEIWFDPRVVSFRRILDTFWRIHTPSERTSSQYKQNNNQHFHIDLTFQLHIVQFEKTHDVFQKGNSACVIQCSSFHVYKMFNCTYSIMKVEIFDLQNFLNLYSSKLHGTLPQHKTSTVFFYLSSIKLKLFYLLY